MAKVFSVEVSDSLGGEIAVVRPQRLVYIESFPINSPSLLASTLLLQDIYIVWRGGGGGIVRSKFLKLRRAQTVLDRS